MMEQAMTALWDLVMLTQAQIAQQLGTKKSAISRLENHAEDVRLSTLHAYAQAVGARLQIQFVTV